MNFELNFNDAIEEVLKGNFVQGEFFEDGLYITISKERLTSGDFIIVDAKQLHTKVMNLNLTKGMIQQKYRMFKVANKAIKEG